MHRKLSEVTKCVVGPYSSKQDKELNSRRLQINFLPYFNDALPKDKIICVQECYLIEQEKKVVIAYKLEEKLKEDSRHHATYLSLDYKNQGDLYAEIIDVEKNPQKLEELKTQYQNEMKLFYKENENLDDAISVRILPQNSFAKLSYRANVLDMDHLHASKQENSTFFMKTLVVLGAGLFATLAYKGLTKSDVVEHAFKPFKF